MYHGCVKAYHIQVAGAGFGGPLCGQEKHYTQKTNLKTEIKDGHNSTKIGASNIFGGNQLRF